MQLDNRKLIFFGTILVLLGLSIAGGVVGLTVIDSFISKIEFDKLKDDIAVVTGDDAKSITSVDVDYNLVRCEQGNGFERCFYKINQKDLIKNRMYSVIIKSGEDRETTLQKFIKNLVIRTADLEAKKERNKETSEGKISIKEDKKE